jgi:hypothetical protein
MSDGVSCAELMVSQPDVSLYNEFVQYLYLMKKFNLLHLVYEGDKATDNSNTF